MPYVKKSVISRVAGINYENRQDIVETMTDDTKLVAKREPENLYDDNAIAIYAMTSDGLKKVGYLPKQLAQQLSPYMKKGGFLQVFNKGIEVEQYGKGKKQSNFSFKGVKIEVVYFLSEK